MRDACRAGRYAASRAAASSVIRSEEHTSELQSQSNLVCRLLLEKKKKHPNVRGNESNALGTNQQDIVAACSVRATGGGASVEGHQRLSAPRAGRLGPLSPLAPL